MIFLALDPGKRTGWCSGELQDGVLRLCPNEDNLSLSVVFKMLAEFVDVGGEHVIYEDFLFAQSRDKVDLTPVKVQGVIELYKEWHEPYVQFHKQSPSVQGDKAFYTDDRLKELGVYWAHGKGHARSATKHLLNWANFGAGGEYIDMRTVRLELV